MKPLVISAENDIMVDDVIDVAIHGRRVELAPATKRLLDKRRAEIESYIDSNPDKRAYGFNTGFGHNVRLGVDDPSLLSKLQRSLIRSHSSGVGPDAEIDVVRATMLLRARSLARGHSAVRAIVVETLLAFLNAGVTPAVPSFGSVSASGDLAPLSHIAHALMGEGKVYFRGRRIAAAKALKTSRIKPLVLEMKEGLALNNGVQYSTALGILAAHRLDALLKTAAIATALSAQVMLGADTPFREDLHALRRHAGGQRVAKWVFTLMKGSPLREAHRNYDIDGEIQDPYNLRCAAQILGTCAELLERAQKTFAIETNSVTDNPILLPRGGKFIDIVSGGHFHGMPVAVDLYGLVQAAAIMATLVNLRCERYVDAKRNKGLGADLKWPGDLDLLKRAGDRRGDDAGLRRAQAISSSIMIPEYATAALANAIWGMAMPSHLFSLSTDAGQEDHVSMAANVGLRLLDILPRLADALAIELAFALQASAIRKEMRVIPARPDSVRLGAAACRLNPVSEAVLSEVGRHFHVVKEDRSLSAEIAALARAVLDGDIVRRATDAGMRF